MNIERLTKRKVHKTNSGVQEEKPCKSRTTWFWDNKKYCIAAASLVFTSREKNKNKY